jgi:hypothetical protein
MKLGQLKPTLHKLQFDTKHDYISSNGLKIRSVGQLKRTLHKLRFDTKHDYLSSNGL